MDPLTIALLGGGVLQGLLQKRKSYLDDPAVKAQLAELEKLTGNIGATAQVEKYFAPARSQVQRDITALGPPGASGAVSGALANLSGQEATAKTDLMSRASRELVNTKLGLAQTEIPQQPGIDFGGLAQALAYYKHLKGLGTRGLGTGAGARPEGTGYPLPPGFGTGMYENPFGGDFGGGLP